MEKLDKVDLKLLKLLQKDAKMTTKQLAERTNLTTTPVHERVKRLEKEGYILKHVSVLDREKLQRELIVFCNITLKQHTKEIGKKFVKEIHSLTEVVECYNISGDYDFMLKVMVKDMSHYQDFVLNGLGTLKNIGSAHSVFVMGEIKNTFGIPLN